MTSVDILPEVRAALEAYAAERHLDAGPFIESITDAARRMSDAAYGYPAIVIDGFDPRTGTAIFRNAAPPATP